MTAEQKRASDPRVSAWVSASAGTGKTHVLTDRVLRLLLAGARPEGVLCLTFTRAAAAEMTTRIFGRLAKWARMTDADLRADLDDLGGAGPEADPETARRLFATALDVPGGLKIMTIHAFCQSLLGRFPVEAGLAPHFQVMDERSTQDFLAEAARQIMAEAADNDAFGADLALLSAAATEEGFLRLVMTLTAERGKLERLLAFGLDKAISRLYDVLGLEAGDNEDAIIAAACTDPGIDEDALGRAARALARSSKVDRTHAEHLKAWLEGGAHRVDLYETYRHIFFTTTTNALRAKLAHKQAIEAMPEICEVLEREAHRLNAFEQRRRLARIARASAALLRLGARLYGIYRDLKSQHQVLDYDDLIFRARDLLTGGTAAAWVLYKLDGGIDHILIDEAQDTNPEQWEVVRALAEEFFAGEGARDEPRTIFAVGDPKQSIFSFQRADPREFERCREFFSTRIREAREGFRDVDLRLSFRSTDPVLTLVDQVFADPAMAEGVVFRKGETVTHQANRTGFAGRVELWPLERAGEKENEGEDDWTLPVERRDLVDPGARLARRIAGRIRDWLDSEEWLEARGRPVRPGDILILVRTRAAFAGQLLRALKARNIPVTGADRMWLSEQLAVMDLLALGRFVLLPEDDLNLAVVLKSPLIGLDDEALFRLAYGRKGSLWRALAARRDDGPAFRAAHDLLADLLARADFAPPFDFYSHVLVEGGGRARLLARLGAEANDPIDEFLNLALAYERLHPPGLQGFLQWFEAGESEIKRDMEQGRDEVRIMTIHGAKGLQAPIVILPDTCSVPDDRNQVFWHEDDISPLPVWMPRRDDAAGPVAEWREERRLRDLEEYRRLLYVALTRAEDRLYIGGWLGRKNNLPDDCWYCHIERAFEALAGVETLETPAGPTRVLATPQEVAAKYEEAKPDSAPVPASPPDWAQVPAPSEGVVRTRLRPSQLDAAEPPVDSPLSQAVAGRYRRGTLIHRLLEVLPGRLPADREALARRILKRDAPELGDDEARALIKETLAVLDSSDFAAVFGPGSRAEVPVAGMVAGLPVTGQIDRLVVTPDAVLIIDYKTNRRPPERAEDVPPVYLAQMAVYRALIRDLYPDRAVRCALLWTDTLTLMALDDEVLNQHLPHGPAPSP